MSPFNNYDLIFCTLSTNHYRCQMWSFPYLQTAHRAPPTPNWPLHLALAAGSYGPKDTDPGTCSCSERVKVLLSRTAHRAYRCAGTGGDLSLLFPLLLTQYWTKELHQAARDGNTGTIAKVLGRGQSVDATDKV